MPHLSTYLQSISPLVAIIVLLITCGIANFVMGYLLAVGVISTKRAIINNTQKKVERFFEV
jgi:hypothetical protein